MVAEIVVGERRVWDKVCIPAICFTDPEIVTVDLSLEEVRATGIEINTGYFPFQANGRAMTLANKLGFIRVLARADNHLLLGIQGVGSGIAELSAAFSLALEMRARLEDVAATIHAHPTQSEGFPGPLSRLWVIRSTYKHLSSMALGGGISMKWRHGFAPLGNQGSAGTSQPLAT